MKAIAAALVGTILLGPVGPVLDEDAPQPSGDRIVWGPTQGLVLHKRLERKFSGTLKTITARRGDEEEVGELGKDIEGKTVIVLRDVYEERVPKRVVLVRTFEELTNQFGLVDGSQFVERTSPFEGLAVRMVWDWGAGGGNSTVLTEDSPADAKVEELLKDLVPLAGDLVAFLKNTIEIGDTWDLDWTTFKTDVLQPSGYLAWQSDPPNPRREWVDRKVFEAYEGEIEATYTRRGETELGDVLIVVSFEGTFGGDVELDIPVNQPVPSHVTAEYAIEGTMEWNLTRSLPHRLLMTARGTKTETHEREDEAGVRSSVELETDLVWEDEFTYE